MPVHHSRSPRQLGALSPRYSVVLNPYRSGALHEMPDLQRVDETRKRPGFSMSASGRAAISTQQDVPPRADRSAGRTRFNVALMPQEQLWSTNLHMRTPGVNGSYQSPHIWSDAWNRRSCRHAARARRHGVSAQRSDSHANRRAVRSQRGGFSSWIRRREVSARDVMTAHLARIERSTRA